jgi:hypothetical protein
MVKHNGLVTALAVTIGVLAAGAQQVANAGDFGSLDQAVNNSIEAAKAEARGKSQGDFGAHSSGACMVGAMIDRGGDSALVWSFALQPGKNYLFVAAGDSDVSGIELACSNKGEDKPFDTQTGRSPVSYLEIPADKESAVVRVAVKVTAARDPSDFVAVVCLESGQTAVSLDDIKRCSAQLTGGISRNPDSANLGLDEDYDDVCLYAALVSSDAPDRAFRRTFRKGVHYVLNSSGDTNCKDVTMSVFHRDDDGSEGKQVGQDTAPEGPDSFMEFDAGTDDDWKGNLHINVAKFSDPSKPSFVVTSILVRK